MSEYGEPWEASPLGFAIGIGGKGRILHIAKDESAVREIRRAIAAVNACAGLTFGPDGIDRNEVGWIVQQFNSDENRIDSLESDLTATRALVAELVGALRDIEFRAEEAGDESADLESSGAFERIRQTAEAALDKARRVLALAKAAQPTEAQT